MTLLYLSIPSLVRGADPNPPPETPAQLMPPVEAGSEPPVLMEAPTIVGEVVEEEIPIEIPVNPEWPGKPIRDAFAWSPSPHSLLSVDGLIRGYYRNDQRIRWSGMEDTFGAEGVLRPILEGRRDRWAARAVGEFFINQPFGQNILSDPPRRVYRPNFEIQTFEIFQLNVQVERGDFRVILGKRRTPFGRYDFPMFSNQLFDAPFIRSDIIDWTETGAFVQYTPGFLWIDVGVVNGDPNLDTNSDKGFVGRVGLQGTNWSVGLSAKANDGIGSEFQKVFRSYYGFDFLVRRGSWTLSGEGIFDEYGFKYDLFNIAGTDVNIGPRSFYGRDVFYRLKTPATGVGYYLNLAYRRNRFETHLNFGSYYPLQNITPVQAEPIHRGLVKLAYYVTPHLRTFLVGLVENSRPYTSHFANYAPFVIYTGAQYEF